MNAIEHDRRLKTWPFNWRLMTYRPGSFSVHSLLRMLFLAAPAVPGSPRARSSVAPTAAPPAGRS